MANNRMLLFCNTCHPPQTTKADAWPAYDDPGILHIAKWYPVDNFMGIPTDGAYYNVPDSKRIEKFLTDHQHLEVQPSGVENPVRLEYETWVVDMPAIKKWEYKK